MKLKLMSLLLFIGFVAMTPLLEARIKLVDFINESEVPFKNKFKDGTPFMKKIIKQGGVLIDKKGAVLESENGEYKIIFQEGGWCGLHRPHWKFFVLVESKHGFPKLAIDPIVQELGENKERTMQFWYWYNWPDLKKNRELYGIILYDGDGNFALKINKNGTLKIIPGYDVKNIMKSEWADDLTIDNSYRE